MKHLSSAAGCFALATLLFAGHANAKDPFPEHSVDLIVPATAGGPVDTAARLIKEGLAPALGQTVVLLNRPGASGTLGMHAVANATPDGYTIGQGVNSIFTITPITKTKVPFTLKDFTLLGDYATGASVLAVSPDSPWKTIDDLIAYARKNPGKLTYASAGVGTVSSLSVQALLHHLNLHVVAVPYQGGAQLTVALLGKQVDMGMVPVSSGAAMFRANKLRPLLTTASERLRALPNVPTLAEKGVSVNGLNLIMGLYAPDGLPADVKQVLINAVEKAAHDPTVVSKLDAIGLIAHYEDPQSALKRLQAETKDIQELAATFKN